MLAENRKQVAEQEGTRDPIFLLEVSRTEVAQASFDNELYVENDYFKGGGVFLTPESYNDYEAMDFSDEEAAEEFWRNCKTMDNEALMNHGLAIQYWDTDSVWLTREEAQQHAEKRSHHYGKEGIQWRVYCVCAEGELAKLLTGGIAKGTNYLPNTKEEEKWNQLKTL